jgi:hypothetical protein
MLKKTVKYLDIIQNEDGSFDDIEKEEIVRFIFTLPSVRLYEQKTGRFFFEDYGKAWKVFTNAIEGMDLKNINDIPIEQQIKLTPMLYDPVINGFMMDVVPCFYAEIQEGKYVQNEETMDRAENSLWLMELVNFAFFTEIFKEISSNQSKTPVKRDNRLKKS